MKNFYNILFFFLLFFSCNKKNDVNLDVNPSIDSLSIYFSLANDFNLSQSHRKKFNQKAYAIIIKQPNDSLNRINLFKIANRYYNMDNLKEYKKTVQVILKNSENTKDTINIIKAFTYLGDYYASQGISDTAFIYYFRAEKIYLKDYDGYNVAKTRLNKALLKYNESDFLGSEIEVFKALSAIKGKEANDVIYESYNLLGVINSQLDEHNKSLVFHTKALANIDEKVIPSVFQSRATSLNNIGFVYQNLNKHKEAKLYFKQGLEQKNLIADKPSLYAMLLDNLAYSEFKLKEWDQLPKLFYQSLKLRDSLRLTAGIITNKIHLSEYFAFKKDTVKAIQFSKEALQTARSSKNYRNALAPLKQLAIIEPQKAAEYTKQYIHINDSLQKAERKMGEKFSRIEYETDKIIDENSDLETKNRNLLFGFSALTMLGLSLFVIKSQKAKNRELLFKQQQQIANEEIYNLMISQQNTIEINRIKEKKRVARELHDGVLGRMFGVRINLDSLNKVVDETAIEKRNNYLTELKNIEQDIREISHDLNREKSELINNFVAIVDNLFEDQKKTYKSKLISNIDSAIKWELVSNSVKINLYRILQEALQNINKYANANTIKIELKKEADHLILKITDDGIGFNVKTAKKGIGLQNILFRAKECDGMFDIKSTKGEGTIITVTAQ
ncbi:tetratricopeptide repeat-containing sensor histidine kinase [Flavobacterium xueshanense]|uniref:tetratricopeptide repeat-containing sensor histidine kinase n=1 Tax=Flavobacterium xueshanense TaxID=935223 RepID=UPI001FCC8E2A|nr:tetratricopeptide repeat-containing sensor histidine kinase [Flavobacterium xueshanense]